MDYGLPTQFDLIVIGTGIVESIVSAAASRIGKNVLHIDSKDYYGGVWASFNLESIDKFGSKSLQNHGYDKNSPLLQDGETILKVGNDLFNIENVVQKWMVPEKTEETEVAKQELTIETNEEATENKEACASNEIKKDVWTQEKLIKDSRKFNIDIAPKLQFARGDFVELLISSNIARYSEYRSVSRVLTWLNGQLEVVPCSRSDVFSNTKVSVIEKRMLMKLLTACMDGDENEFKGYENKTFRNYLKEKKLTDNLVHYVLYAISMCTNETPCLEGVENTKRFLNSLGRFGKTPFLYSMYGSGELSQAFCRLSAVFGGLYALNQQLNGLIFDSDGNCKSLLSGKQRISAEHIVMGIEYCPESFVKSVEKSYISRGIFITDRSVMESETENLTLLLFPLEGGKQICNVIELGSLTGTCPKNIHIVHMFTRQNASPKEDLEECVGKIFQDEAKVSDVEDPRPKVLWSLYYSVPDTSASDLRNGLPKNVFVCPGPDVDLDYDESIKKAREIFLEIYPDLEFLPRAPDPEEIIIGDEDAVTEDEEINHQKIEDENDINAKKEEQEAGKSADITGVNAEGDAN